MLAALLALSLAQPPAIPTTADGLAAGRALYEQGRYSDALVRYEEAVQAAKAAGDRSAECRAVNQMASAHRQRFVTSKDRPAADAEAAVKLYTRGRLIARTTGQVREEAYANLYLAQMGVHRGDKTGADTAVATAAAAVGQYLALGDTLYYARALVVLGDVKLRLKGDPAGAVPLFEAAMPLFRELKQWRAAAEMADQLKAAYVELAGPPVGPLG